MPHKERPADGDRSGALAAIAASLTIGASDAPVVAAQTLTLIDQAEALALAICEIAPRLSERDLSNLNHVLDQLVAASTGGPARFVERLADDTLAVGLGNRIHDQMDAQDAAVKRARITHATAVAGAVEVYHAGGIEVGTELRADLARAYGDDLDAAIERAGFNLYMHQLYHADRDPLICCNDD